MLHQSTGDNSFEHSHRWPREVLQICRSIVWSFRAADWNWAFRLTKSLAHSRSMLRRGTNTHDSHDMATDARKTPFSWFQLYSFNQFESKPFNTYILLNIWGSNYWNYWPAIFWGTYATKVLTRSKLFLFPRLWKWYKRPWSGTSAGASRDSLGLDMGGSINGGIPKWMIYKGKSQ